MILAILGIQIVLGACKTEVIFEPGWVGKWMIYQIDSAYDVWWLDTITVMEVFLDQGYIEFFDDSTGYLEITTSHRLHCMDSNFVWSSFRNFRDTILLSDPSGYKVLAWGLDMRAEELILRLPTCEPPSGVGAQGLHYRIYSRRTK